MKPACLLLRLTAIFTLVASVAGAVAATPTQDSLMVSKIVIARGPLAGAESLIISLGGTIQRQLPVVSGVAARMPVSAIDRLEASSLIASVTDNAPVFFAEEPTSATSANSVYTREVNADRLWENGVDGTAVTVALIDTGIHSAVQRVASKVVTVTDPFAGGATAPCINLSGEPHCDDSYGHGTFIAGLIAGDANDQGLYQGVAPGASLLSVKIAGRDGSADVSKVLAAIQWVVSFKDTYRIRVLNLSLGTTGRAPTAFDPLNLAVQRAWDAGIAVVVSAGNRGPEPRTISKPADDPLVISVGAVDDRETPAIDDDRLPRFSSRGPTAHGVSKPDIVAPGGRLVSLRAPGSLIESKAPGGIDSEYRRGSGTSMSAAVVSGVAALAIQNDPTFTPDRLKFSMMYTARKVAARDAYGVGRGLVDARAIAYDKIPPSLPQQRAIWLGGATLDHSRGGVFVTRPCTPIERAAGRSTCKLEGQITAQGKPFDADDYQREWSQRTWDMSQWLSGVPEGSSWYDLTTEGSSWYGSSWYDIGTEGSSWYGSSWYGSSWYGYEDPSSWYGTSMEGSSWYGAWE